MIKSAPIQDVRRSGYPLDLREAGKTDDPLFDRPLVYGRIDTGVVEIRCPGSEHIERHEVRMKRSRGKEQTTMSHPGKTHIIDDIEDKTKRIADLYNDGMPINKIASAVGISASRVYQYLRRAEHEGLIKERRAGRVDRKPTAASSTETEQPESSAKSYDVDVLRRISDIETRLNKLAKDQQTATSDPRFAIIQSLPKELETIRREMDILVSGLNELTRRVNELAQRRPVDGDQRDMTQDLVRLLELALTEGRRTA